MTWKESFDGLPGYAEFDEKAVAKIEGMYPHIDLATEAECAASWIRTASKSRRPAKSSYRFFLKWLSRQPRETEQATLSGGGWD